MVAVKDFNGNKLTFQGSKELSHVGQCPTKSLICLDNINIDIFSGKRIKTTSIEV